jgi:hypothetical protein
MKGRLIKTEKGWSVRYLGHPVTILAGEERLVNTIPVYPDDVIYCMDSDLNKEVEFEIVNMGYGYDDNILQYAKL